QVVREDNQKTSRLRTTECITTPISCDVQKQVLGLYRGFLRADRSKGPERRSNHIFLLNFEIMPRTSRGRILSTSSIYKGEVPNSSIRSKLLRLSLHLLFLGPPVIEIFIKQQPIARHQHHSV
ncbi:hypothetical protein C5167_014558, partial [Papaver somniferum]